MTATFKRCKFVSNLAISDGDDVHLTFDNFDVANHSLVFDSCIFEKTKNLGIHYEAISVGLFINLLFSFTNNVINYTDESSFFYNKKEFENCKIQSICYGNYLVSKNDMLIQSFKNGGVAFSDDDFSICKDDELSSSSDESSESIESSEPSKLPSEEPNEPSKESCYYMSDRNVTIKGRCYYIENGNNEILIHVIKTDFSDLNEKEPGATIYLITRISLIVHQILVVVQFIVKIHLILKIKSLSKIFIFIPLQGCLWWSCLHLCQK